MDKERFVFIAVPENQAKPAFEEKDFLEKVYESGHVYYVYTYKGSQNMLHEFANIYQKDKTEKLIFGENYVNQQEINQQVLEIIDKHIAKGAKEAYNKELSQEELKQLLVYNVRSIILSNVVSLVPNFLNLRKEDQEKALELVLESTMNLIKNLEVNDIIVIHKYKEDE